MSGPLPAWLAPVTIPASWVYRMGVAMRNRRYDRRGATHVLDRPVVSVGNITTGGTGKTPMVMSLARTCQQNNVNAVIALRGYGPKTDGISDEQAEYILRLPDVPVIASPTRAASLHTYIQSEQGKRIDCVLLDDGFQHRQLHRDLDIVLIDAQRETMNDRLLPAGHLREPLTNLKRADAVVVTRAEKVDDQLAEAITRYHGRPPIAWTRHRWSALDVYDGGIVADSHPPAWLNGRRVVTMLGVGHPQSVRSQIQAHRATVVDDVTVSDHVEYDSPRVQAVRRRCAGADGLVVTNKDWVKLSNRVDFADWPVPVIVPQVDLEFIDGERAFVQLVEQIVNHTTSKCRRRPDRTPQAERAAKR